VTIDPSQMVKALRRWTASEGTTAGPHSSTSKREGSLIDETGLLFVRGLLSTLTKSALQEDICAAIEKTEIIVLHSEIMNACAMPSANGGRIVIFSGLIKSFIYIIELESLIDPIAQNEDMISKTCHVEIREIRQLGYQAFALLWHYATWKTDLPRPNPKMSRAERKAAILSLAQTLWFLVAHEYAHIKLGHIDDAEEVEGEHQILPALAVDEALTDIKLMEFEADEYLIQCLRPELLPTFLSWTTLPLMMFSSLERLLATDQDSHPMAINRLKAMQEYAKALGQDDEIIAEIVDGQMQAQTAFQTAPGSRGFAPSFEIGTEALRKLQDYRDFAISLGRLRERASLDVQDNIWDGILVHFWGGDA
jgi:hypothetical protein